MKKNIIIFLDIDGVMTSRNTLKFTGKSSTLGIIDPSHAFVLNDILDITRASVVITSMWREMFSITKIQQMFTKAGFKYPERIIGSTSSLIRKKRGDEIALWLSQVHVDAFVILDDDSDMCDLYDKLVQTSFEDGLLTKHVKMVKDIVDKQLSEG